MAADRHRFVMRIDDARMHLQTVAQQPVGDDEPQCALSLLSCQAHQLRGPQVLDQDALIDLVEAK